MSVAPTLPVAVDAFVWSDEPVVSGSPPDNPSSETTVAISLITGGSFTGVTLMVMVFGARSNAPLLSCTLKVKLLYGVPFASLAGVNTSWLNWLAGIT